MRMSFGDEDDQKSEIEKDAARITIRSSKSRKIF